MKAFVDTNILISYLLGSGRDSAASAALRAGFQGTFEMVIGGKILDELSRSVANKPYLRSRISESDLATFVSLITSVAEVVDRIEPVGFDLSRDRSDNFVLLHAIAADVDLILTGDEDLLVLSTIGHARIVNAAALLDLLDRVME